MMDRMTTWHARDKGSVHCYHVEAPGCIINIWVGLHDEAGRKVTRVSVDPDNYVGEEWHIEKDATCGCRVIEGKEEPDGLPTDPD